MIILSRTVADPAGRVILRNYQLSGEYDNTARISRQKTLDGSSVLSHYGTSDTDRNFTVECRLSSEEFFRVDGFFKNGTPLRISFWEGSFTGYIQRMRVQRDGAASLVFYFKENLT
jgi:hypothetical protein